MKNNGKNRDLKIKYIKLAHFLLKHKGGIAAETNHEGLCKYLIQHLSKIISLRELIVQRLSDWIRYLTGDIYSFAHRLEGLKIDQSLLESLEAQIDYQGG